MGRCFWFVLWSRKLNFPTSSRANGRRECITCEFRIFNYSNRFTILGIIAIGISKTNGVFAISSRVSKIYAYIFTIGLYLVIGPFFALPRLATTSYEIAFSPFVSPSSGKWILPVFSMLFFIVAWFFARKPSKILDYIGKFLNPVF